MSQAFICIDWHDNQRVVRKDSMQSRAKDVYDLKIQIQRSKVDHII